MSVAKLRGLRACRQRVAADVARLFSGALSRSEEVELEKRREEQREYQENFLATVQLLADLQPLANDPDLRAIVGQGRAQENVFKPQNFWTKYALAATVLLAGAIGFYGLQQPDSTESEITRFATRVGEQKSIDLLDGSALFLNTGTRLLVEFTSDSRRVILERGEVYFDIAGDPERVFTIDLGVRSVSVLGTEFNILKSPKKITLAVVEGEVSIHGQEETASAKVPLLEPLKGETIQLQSAPQHRVRAGTVAEFDTEQQKLSAYVPTNIQQFRNWRTGVIRFDAVPLAKVVQELNRYSAKKILIEDASIMGMKLYATVRVNELNMAMTVLEHTLPVRITHYFDRIVIEAREK